MAAITSHNAIVNGRNSPVFWIGLFFSAGWIGPFAGGGWPTQAVFWLEWVRPWRATLWQKRYYDFNVRRRQFLEKLWYTHENPVRRGLCAKAEDWPWSSALHYTTGQERSVEIESEWTARKHERAAGTLCAAIQLPHSSQQKA